jgi:hypothetical protein
MYHGVSLDGGQEDWHVAGSTFDYRVSDLPDLDKVHVDSLSLSSFHYDEENGGRPCEAAYLSDLKDGIGRGVKEVVVLVSCVSHLNVANLN